MAGDFQELFDEYDKSQDARYPGLPPMYNASFVKMAKRISIEQRSWLIVFVIFLFAIIFGLFLVEELRIDRYQRSVARIKREMQIPVEDSIQFQCRRCGWQHNLSVIDTSKK